MARSGPGLWPRWPDKMAICKKWTEEQRDRYFDIASKCDKETLIQHHYTADCMHKRNRYMVDQADFIIAVWDGRPSGTGKTVQYAQRQGKPVTIINPKTMLIDFL